MGLDVRAEFAHRVTAAVGWPSGDDRLEAAFRDTPRERFVPPGTPEKLLYSDTTIAIGRGGINNGQPSLHASCLAVLRPQTGETAIHVGAGSGYYTAILARLVGPTGRVVAYELDAELAGRAQRHLEAMAWVEVRAGSGARPAPESGDMVYVNCGATRPQAAWLEALRPGGRLLFPLTGVDGAGAMLLVRHEGDAGRRAARFVMGVAFIGCEGVRDPGEAAAVTAAFQRGEARRVHTLHRGPVPAGARPWCAGSDWWLEAAA